MGPPVCFWQGNEKTSQKTRRRAAESAEKKLVILQKRIAGLSEVALERFALRARRVAKLKGTVNVLVTSSAAVQSLNRQFRGKNKATDVLSFPSLLTMPYNSSRLAGDIAISADIAVQNAHRMGHSAAVEVKILTLHGILHLAGFDHENAEQTSPESRWRVPPDSRQHAAACGPGDAVQLFAGLDSGPKSDAIDVGDAMSVSVAFALLLLVGLLTLVSYVDRVYQEIGKFLSREFQDNIDVFEQKVEPKLGVSRTRAALSMAILTQLTMAAISLLIGYAVFADEPWSIYEILQATISLVLIVIVCNRFLPFLFFSRTKGSWLARWTPLLRILIYIVLPITIVLGFL